MNTTQKTLAQTSFAQVRPIADEAAALFYSRLFELDPTLRPFFKGDMQEQGRKLMDMLTLAVKGLDRPEALLPVLVALGRRHISYGVREHHYETVGEALLWTLEQGLGAGFTPEVREAWTALYKFLADTMRNAGEMTMSPLTVEGRR
jgi:hemoglobin-like flavoprotein